jgi:hypothetical protein
MLGDLLFFGLLIGSFVSRLFNGEKELPEAII